MASPKWQALSRYTACDIADALLKLGVPGAGYLPRIVRSTRVAPEKVIAPASTFLMAPKATPSFPSSTPLPDNFPKSNLADAGPYADHTEPNTIVVISQPKGQDCAVVGGIMAARMKQLGALGVLVDGQIRDLEDLGKTGLHVWSRGTSIIGAGAQTKFHAKNVPIQVENTIVEPGDIIMMDPAENGAVAIPKGKLDEILELLPKIVAADEKVLEDVKQGVPVAEAFKRHRS
ncbi:DlpA domain-containing protein [Periconia macrospinosa]|uniref:DlpA domain-containing protein n=1 Tax=Periconia macrospinosa TaxID=97972 RepID=A0A2V1DLT1_9PLEO|nr:DlpA domain-containing protein [Periconia macrospinosa]